MSDYAKVMKKYIDTKFEISLFHINNFGVGDQYIQFMKERYSEKYSQVIINSGLMLEIIESAIKDEWTLIQIVIDDPSVDEHSRDEIKSLVDNIKKDSIYFNDLKLYLDWALDEGSIFIDSIRLAKTVNDKIMYCDVFSKGLLYSTGKEKLFEMTIKQIIEEYLNGKQ